MARLMNTRWSRRAGYLALLADRVPRRRARATMAAPCFAQNPYQSLIYRAWRAPVGCTDIDTALKACRVGLAGVLHLHWDEYLFDPRNMAVAEARLAQLARLRAGGVRIAWTLHNEIPHAPLDADELARFHDLRRRLFELADALHVHSRHARDAFSRTYGIDPERFGVVEHPSYDGCYPPARLAWAPQETRRFLSFGVFRRYKGIETALEAFAGLEAPDLPPIEYRLAGKGAAAFAEGFEAGPGKAATLSVLDDYIPDAQVADLFAQADFMVLPFSRTLTSGSLILGLTMGVPAIAPALPPILELLPEELHAFTYDPDDPADFRRALERAARLDAAGLQACRAAARSAAEPLNADRISRRLERLIAPE